MPTITVREIHGDELLEVLYWLPTYAFTPSPPLKDKAEELEMLRQNEDLTCFALFEDDEPVACAANAPLTQQVRGKLFSIGGIMGVATHPAARRKGYSRRVLTQLLTSLREQKYPLSCLYPFRESFYERLGYVMLPSAYKCKFSTSNLHSLLKQDLGGEFELTLLSENYDVYLDFVNRQRDHTHGLATFDRTNWANVKKHDKWLVQAKVEGELVGVMLYDLKEKENYEFHMQVPRFYYDTSQGKYMLLRWIAQHIDQAIQAEINLPSYEQLDMWLPDLDVKVEALFAPMGRVLDVATIGGIQTGPGRLAVHITDPLSMGHEGAWQFETVDGQLQVNPAPELNAEDGCTLSIHALAALVYGTHDPADFVFRGWGNPSSELQAIMRTMFPPMQPYLHSYF